MTRMRAVAGAALLCSMTLPALAIAANGNGASSDDAALLPLAVGGILFLYGFLKLGEAIKLLAGERMREVVSRLSGHRLTGFVAGAGMTAIVLSSATTLSMLVGFVSAQLISFSQTIGVILGAALGATVAGQLLAFPLTGYAPHLLGAGLLLLLLGRGEPLRQSGHLLLGLGLVFLGMGQMETALATLRGHPWLLLFTSPSQLGTCLLLAALLAVLLRSTTTVVVGVIVLGMSGVVALENTVALILGANLGAVAAPFFAAMGKRREAWRVAVAHALIKGAGVAALMGFIPECAEVIRHLSPQAADLNGPARLIAEIPRQAAHAHTLFNLMLAGLFLPLAALVVRGCEILVPDPAHGDDFPEAGAYVPRYLDRALLSTPALALGMMRRETSLMCSILERMIAEAPDAVLAGDVRKMEVLRRLDDQVDEIHEAVTRYLSRMSVLPLPVHIADEVLAAMAATAEMEAVGDLIENNLAHLAQVCSLGNLRLAPENLDTLTAYHKGVLQAFKSATTAFISDDRQAAELVLGMKEGIRAMDEACRAQQMQLLQTGVAGGMAAYALQMDVRENLTRIYYHARRVARLVLRESDPLWAVPSR